MIGPNIETNKSATRYFRDAVKAQDWPQALATLASAGLTAKPSQAPALRDAIRKDPTLIDGRHMAERNGGRIAVTSAVLADERDEHGAVTAGWLADPERLTDRYPHFSTAWKAEYQIKHHVAFGRIADAIKVLREWRLSCTFDDFGGELARGIMGNVGQQAILRDGGTFAVRGEA